MRLILVRHIEIEANAAGKYIGQSYSEYSERGLRQLDYLFKLLLKEKIDKIYSSPLPRALKLAKLFSVKKASEVLVEEALKEMNFGIFEGKAYQEIMKEMNREWEKWCSDYINYRIPEGESFLDFHQRVIKFIDKLVKGGGENTYLLVTHGGVIRSSIVHLLSLDIEQAWHFKITPASVVEIEYKDGYGVITRLINKKEMIGR